MYLHLERFKDLKYSEHKDVIDSSFVNVNNINLFNKIMWKLFSKEYVYKKNGFITKQKKIFLINIMNVIRFKKNVEKETVLLAIFHGLD